VPGSPLEPVVAVLLLLHAVERERQAATLTPLQLVERERVRTLLDRRRVDAVVARHVVPALDLVLVIAERLRVGRDDDALPGTHLPISVAQPLLVGLPARTEEVVRVHHHVDVLVLREEVQDALRGHGIKDLRTVREALEDQPDAHVVPLAVVRLLLRVRPLLGARDERRLRAGHRAFALEEGVPLLAPRHERLPGGEVPHRDPVDVPAVPDHEVRHPVPPRRRALLEQVALPDEDRVRVVRVRVDPLPEVRLVLPAGDQRDDALRLGEELKHVRPVLLEPRVEVLDGERVDPALLRGDRRLLVHREDHLPDRHVGVDRSWLPLPELD
jgi:hypothetical protein